MSSRPQTLPCPGEVLPHGAAFRFVDQVLALGARDITACRLVPRQEPWTEAHFPGAPLVPGVLLLEGMAQTCGLLARQAGGEATATRQGMLVAIRTARFYRPAHPGAMLIYRAELLVSAGPLRRFHATTWVGEERVAEAEICLHLGEAAPPDAAAGGGPS